MEYWDIKTLKNKVNLFIIKTGVKIFEDEKRNIKTFENTLMTLVIYREGTSHVLYCQASQSVSQSGLIYIYFTMQQSADFYKTSINSSTFLAEPPSINRQLKDV